MAARVDQSVWQGFYWRPDPEDPAVARAISAGQRPVQSAAEAGYVGGSGSPIAAGGDFRHLVLIIEESLGGEFWRNPEVRARYMPRISALAERGVSFESVYSTEASRSGGSRPF